MKLRIRATMSRSYYSKEYDDYNEYLQEPTPCSNAKPVTLDEFMKIDDEVYWLIEINSLEDLIKLMKDTNERLVLFPANVNNKTESGLGWNTTFSDKNQYNTDIEIYNTWRE